MAYSSELGKTEQTIATGTTILELMNEVDDKKVNDENWPLPKLFEQRIPINADLIEFEINFLQKNKQDIQKTEEMVIALKRRLRLKIIILWIILGVMSIGLFLLALLRKKQ